MTRQATKRVEWAITAACDLGCQHCYARPADPRKELTRQQTRSVVEQLHDAGCTVVTLSGGEPLLHPFWEEIARELHARGMVVQVVSNGQQLCGETARRLRETGVTAVFLSLDGTRATHDRIRGRAGAFDRVLRAAEGLQKQAVPVGFISTLLRPNAGELASLAEITRDAGSVVWQVWLGIPTDDSDLWLRPSELPSVARALTQASRINDRLVLGDNLGYGGSTERLRRGDGLERGRWGGCEAGRSILGIRSDGRVTGCLAMAADQDVGSLREERLTKLWDEAGARRTARRQSLARSGCGRCRQSATCRAGCHATAMSLRTNEALNNRFCMARPANLRPARGPEAAMAAGVMLASFMVAGCHSADAAPPETPAPTPMEPPTPVVTVTAEPPEEPIASDPSNVEPLPEPVEPGPEPVGPSNAHRNENWSMPSCCMAHMIRPDCQCGGPVILPDGGP